MDLVRHFDQGTFVDALEDWAWRPGIAGLVPQFATALGDIFFLHPDGSFAFLDVTTSELGRLAPDEESFRAALDLEAVQERCFHPALVEAAAQLGIALAEGEILDYIVPPALGGVREASNLQAADFVVTISTLGQIHRQVAGLPEGTPIAGVEVEPEARGKRRWFGSR